MSLRSFPFEIRYRSSRHNLLQDFYIPCMERAVIYQRAAGYFSTAHLMTAARGLARFIKCGGKMQLVACPEFSEADIEAMRIGLSRKEEIVGRVLDKSLIDLENEFVNRRFQALAWLLAQGLLEIKIALYYINGKVSSGIYHEKVGIFTDKNGDYLTFSGSGNETGGGYIYNFESFDVQCSWNGPEFAKLAALKRAEFNELWENNTHNLEIISLPEAIARKIIRCAQKHPPTTDPEEKLGRSTEKASGLAIAPPSDLRKHQMDALGKWKANGWKGVLEHATGSGKTFTALGGIAELYKNEQKVSAVIVVPFNHLVEQWENNCQQFGIQQVVKTHHGKDKWLDRLNRKIVSFNNGLIDHLVIITTTATFTGVDFQALLPSLPQTSILIGDEVHNLGAPEARQLLPGKFIRRLGLSATPERGYDSEGTKAIFEYFGGVIHRYSLEQALSDGFLCHYDCYPHLVELTNDEAEEYYSITKEIARYSAALSDDSETCDNPGLKSKLIERARLIGRAENKLEVLRRVIAPYRESFYSMVYCGDSKNNDEKQIEAVCRILGSDLKMAVDKFTFEESSDERRDILKRFEDRRLQAIVSIRCLDEGLDMPRIERAFLLASSTSPRQFIQRRGRILRKHPEKEFAEIHDFIVIPPGAINQDCIDKDVYRAERSLLRRELIRFIDFSRNARNGAIAREKLLPLRQKYHLMDI